jgi:hypothetical protein
MRGVGRRSGGTDALPPGRLDNLRRRKTRKRVQSGERVMPPRKWAQENCEDALRWTKIWHRGFANSSRMISRSSKVYFFFLLICCRFVLGRKREGRQYSGPFFGSSWHYDAVIASMSTLCSVASYRAMAEIKAANAPTCEWIWREPLWEAVKNGPPSKTAEKIETAKYSVTFVSVGSMHREQNSLSHERWFDSCWKKYLRSVRLSWRFLDRLTPIRFRP